MDSTLFYDMFPQLNIKGDISTTLKDAVVQKVSTNSNKTLIRIYLSFNTLVPKTVIWKLEESIRKQVFPNDTIKVKIIEDFNLSGNYTPSYIYEEYNDSILDDIHKYSNIVFDTYKRSDIEFPEKDLLLLTIEDTPLAQDTSDDLVAILNRIFVDRCHQDIRIELAHKEYKASKIFAQSDEEIRKRIVSISEAYDEAVSLSDEEKAEKAAKRAERKAAKEAEGSNKSNSSDTSVKSSDTNKENSSGTDKADTANKSKFGNGGRGFGGGFNGRRGYTKPNIEGLIYGKPIEEEAVAISDIVGDIGTVTIRGKIINSELKELKNGERFIFMATITDFTDSIKFKLFTDKEGGDELSKALAPGKFCKIKGNAALDTFEREVCLSYIAGIEEASDFTVKRIDNSVDKRVELHLHTKFSEYDGVSDIKDIIKQAYSWGHRAMAITDHGVVQCFPPADHALHDLKYKDMKLIYGCEIYLVDDTKELVINPKNQSFDDDFVVFDIETTGLNSSKHKIIEIGAVKVVNGEIVDRFDEFVNPGTPIPYRITELTTINDATVRDASDISVVLPKFLEFCGDCVLVAHNAEFDVGFIKHDCAMLGLDFDYTYIDTMPLARYMMPSLGSLKLDKVCEHLGVVFDESAHHRADYDAEGTAGVLLEFIKRLKVDGINTLAELNEKAQFTPEMIKKMRPHHCIVLAKNDIGRTNLYRLISESHLNYFARFPRVPKSLVEEFRDGLIIGSACEAGELFQAILMNRADSEIARIVKFYDYLEIQPDGNNEFMIRSEKADYEEIKSVEDLHEINRKIVALADEFKKPCVATCDVHFLNPEDEIYRRIIMASKGFDDADQQAPLYLHTTEEMLEEFAYLGAERAREVVIDNTNLIANMCEPIAPTRPDKAPPVIENSDETLRKICYNKAHSMYGPDLPEQVEARLSRELNSIISNGYAVMYIIAQKLVWKSVEDGYLVGSRGSVGSSFVATMSGITEVNPLSPHYLCSECYYVDFDSDEVKEYAGRAGVDMPDKVCPKCGKPLTKQGFDIPFETFLGFYGDKEPDIDLNFSGDYQTKAHKYTEVIFGDGQTFKAGTIGTIADKTAYGMVKKYYEERGLSKRGCEIDRVLLGCTGVKNTTGQHPGGVVVLPVGEEIYSFTPIQHPANKDTDIITTHFEYHSIDANLLKLDILGHADPTMIRSLEDLIGIDATKIPLDDKNVMSLFQSPAALGVSSEDLMGTKTGTLGIPEFGTDFAMGMLLDAKPREFTDLVRIAGLAHGTDVWQGNAEVLIKNGIATISTAICTRDDIMTYLINMGLEAGDAFKIMEQVRKGVVAKGKCEKWPQYKADMLAHNVPDWYVDSCEKIKYMFPKAHAVAYVMMAWRVAYCKIYHPLEYYASYFSIRADAFDYELMCLGREACENNIKNIRAMDKKSPKDDATLKDLRLVQEMYARGFEFLPIDLYKSDARYFKVVDGKLLPPFTSISGMGDKAAETLFIEASRAPFLSLDDVKDRGKVNGTVIDTMVRLGILSNLPQSNQMSIFDIFDS